MKKLMIVSVLLAAVLTLNLGQVALADSNKWVVLLAHYTGNGSNRLVLIEVDLQAMPAHLAHGDLFLGAYQH